MKRKHRRGHRPVTIPDLIVQNVTWPMVPFVAAWNGTAIQRLRSDIKKQLRERVGHLSYEMQREVQDFIDLLPDEAITKMAQADPDTALLLLEEYIHRFAWALTAIFVAREM